MPEIVLTDITKRWKGFYAVENLNLKIADNAFVTLLGPSGCGKTTTLRMIAGLETPTSGRITIGDRVVFDSDAGINVPPNKRKVGFLFQNYALWPNMTVYQNIAFGLENVKDELPAVDFKAREAAKMIEILSAPQKVLDVVAECYDKNNKLDKSKLSLHLIDTFTISQYTAKKLMALELQSAADVNKTAEEQKKSYEKILADQQVAAASSGQSLNENCEFVKDGKVVTSLRKLTKEEIDLSVRRVSRIVKIGIFMDRYPAELSGGQQQRVAIARTLAPEPSVLFMDEPLSNLDAKLRLEMRSELQRLHIETGSTFVYVTHDQMEAMTLATEICLINNGVLQQYDAPLTVYGRPNNTFVADFVGNPSINFVENQANEKGSELELSFFEGQKAVFTPVDGTVLADWNKADHAKDEALAAELKAKLQDKKYVEKSNKDVLFKCPIPRIEESELETEREITDQDLILAIRPEAISICEDGKLEGEIYSAMPTGMEITVRVRIGNFLLTGVAFGGITYKIGQKVRLNFNGDGILLYSARSGRLITAGSLKLL